jgi:hypothetical protein
VIDGQAFPVGDLDRWTVTGNDRRLVKIALYTVGAVVVSMIGLVALVPIFRDELIEAPRRVRRLH